MFDDCQPVLINNLYGSLTVNTNDSSSCIKSRQWYFFYDYGYILLIRLINITHFISKSYIFKIYSIINKQETLVYDSSNATIVNNEIQFDTREKNSGILVELIPIKHKNIQQGSFIIDYAFRATSHSRYGRQILQDNSSSTFSPSQPSFIALICVIAILLVAIIATITIFCYRHCSYRQHAKKRQKIRDKFRRVLNNQQSTDQTHLASSITPSSASSHSIRSSRRFSSHHHHPAIQSQQQTSSLDQGISTLPSIMPSHRLQQSMMDAYITDFNSFQPKPIDLKQLNSYLFIDLHSTSSETCPDTISKQYPNDNTTTSGYDTSTGGEDRHTKNSFLNRRRRRYYHHRQRQQRRSTKPLKRSMGPRFLMRERSLPSTLVKLPQLRQQRHSFGTGNNNSSTTNSNNNQDLLSTNLSTTTTTDDYDESHAYHVQRSRIMNTIEEEKPSVIHKPSSKQPYFFEMVSTHRGDDSDMPNYEDMRIPFKSSPIIADGISYVNDSIIV